MLVGAAVRMAECMGLNRDGSKAYNLNPADTHIRRLIWHQLCFLDIRTCEAQGPKPAIRREDYDTWLPDNVEEDQLTNGTCPARPREGWTSNLLPLIRFEINEMMRIIWADRRKLESRRTTLTQVLFKIEKFRKRMLENYDRLLDERIPIQRYAKLVMHLLMYRLHVMILHPYYANTANPMPQRLRSVLIMSAMVIIELAMQLDTNPAFRLWRWYGGAYQQYQAALILATEMFYHPNHKDASRIWACLDYVFGLECNTPTEDKGRQVLAEIMGKMGVYMSMRRTRAPTATASASPAKQAVKTEEEDVVIVDDDDGADDDDDDDDAAAVAAAAAVLARAGMENAALPNDTGPVHPPLFEQLPGVSYRDHPPAPLLPHHRLVDRAPMIMMKQEPGTVPPMPPGPATSSSCPGGNVAPPAMPTLNRTHYHHLNQGQQQLPPGSASMATVPPPPSLGQRGGGGGATSNPNMMLAAMMAATEATGTIPTTTTGCSNNDVLWSMAPMSVPPLLNNNNNNSNRSHSNAESPSNSSPDSDIRSVDGLGGSGQGPCHYSHCQAGAGGSTTTSVPTDGGSSNGETGGPTSNGSNHLLDNGGDWVRFQQRHLFIFHMSSFHFFPPSPLSVCIKSTWLISIFLLSGGKTF